MSGRQFSDRAKYEVVKNNIEKHNGEVRCEICGEKISSIDECHFDHIVPFAKGGKSITSNCQILCAKCNLKKNDKELKDFILEEKAKSFLEGKSIEENDKGSEEDEKPIENFTEEDTNDSNSDSTKMTKEKFDEQVSTFIEKKGDIHKVDFTREYNHLPPVHYINKYYGDLSTLKKHFGVEDISTNWNRETVLYALQKYVEENGDIFQKDLVKANKLPSLNCILNYYPECKNFTDVKRDLCNLKVQEQWTKEKAIIAGKEYTETHNSITQKDLKSENGLPSANVINNLFGNINEYQKALGIEQSKRNLFITKESIHNEINEYFGDGERILESTKQFYEIFSFSPSTIDKRYGGINNLYEEENITVLKTKKQKYTKREVDDVISNWVKDNKRIPKAHDLTKEGLPSLATILKYYENWKEPFYIYMKLYEELERN